MRNGQRRHLISITKAPEGRDEAGQPIVIGEDGQPLPWVLVVRLWAHVVTNNGAEQIRSDQETSTVAASFRIPRRHDVNAGHRVERSRGRIYDIKAVLPDEERLDSVDLVCELVT